MTSPEARTPSPACVYCGKTLPDVGGRRVVATQSRGLSLTDEHNVHSNANPPRRAFALADDSQALNFVIWGEFWTDEVIQRALAEIRAGCYPWFCQRCSHHVCGKCGSITAWPVGDVLNDDGSITHVPALPVGTACTNPDCDDFNPGISSISN